MGAPEAWPRWAALRPHVLAAADQFAVLSDNQQDAATVDASWLLDRAAAYLQVHARLDQARPLAGRALAMKRTPPGSY